jgi:hypothetical protein
MAEADTATEKDTAQVAATAKPCPDTRLSTPGVFPQAVRAAFWYTPKAKMLWRAFKGIALFSWENLRKENAPGPVPGARIFMVG